MEEQIGYGNSKAVVDFEQKYPELAYEFQQIQKLRERQEFVKPSVKKRTERLKAIYVQQIKNGLN